MFGLHNNLPPPVFPPHTYMIASYTYTYSNNQCTFFYSSYSKELGQLIFANERSLCVCM
jgi:hypothetical protein